MSGRLGKSRWSFLHCTTMTDVDLQYPLSNPALGLIGIPIALIFLDNLTPSMLSLYRNTNPLPSMKMSVQADGRLPGPFLSSCPVHSTTHRGQISTSPAALKDPLHTPWGSHSVRTRVALLSLVVATEPKGQGHKSASKGF